MYSIALFEAKNKLTEIVREVEAGPPVELTRHGKGVAVLLGLEAWKELSGRAPGLVSAYARFCQDWPVAEGEDSGLDSRALRSTEQGRDFSY